MLCKSPNRLWQFILMHLVLRGKKVVHMAFNTLQLFRDKFLLGFNCERESPKARSSHVSTLRMCGVSEVWWYPYCFIEPVKVNPLLTGPHYLVNNLQVSGTL